MEEKEGIFMVGRSGTGSDALRSITMANSTSMQVVPLPVFLVSLEEELTVLDKLLSVTCADLVVCSHPPRSGESGTKRSTLARSENVPLQPPPAYLQ